GEPVKLGVRKKIRLVAVDLPKGTSYRRPRSGGCTRRLTLRRPSGIPPRMISASTCLSFSSSALTRCFAAMPKVTFGTKRTSRHVSYLSASLIGRLGQALSDYPPVQCRCRSRARASLRTRHQGPFHHGDSKTRWNNLSGDLAVNVTAGSTRRVRACHGATG